MAERSHFVTARLHALVEQASLPEEWRQQLLNHFTWQSPETLTTKQIAAWTEVVGLLNDPAFAEEALRFNTPTLNQAARQMDIAEYNQQALSLIQQAQAAALRGDPLESKLVQTLLRDWIRLVAESTQQTVTSAFLQQLSNQLSTSASERMQRFWTLMASLSGREAPPSYQEGLALLTAGLRLLVSQPQLLSALCQNICDHNAIEG